MIARPALVLILLVVPAFAGDAPPIGPAKPAEAAPKDDPAAVSAPSPRRAADLKKIAERRARRNRQANIASAKRFEALQVRLAMEQKAREAHEAEMAEIRHARMTEAARRQALAEAERRRLQRLNTVETDSGAGTSGEAVRLQGKIKQSVVAVGAETTGTILQATDGMLYELDLSIALLTPEDKKQLDGKTVTIEGLLTLRRGVEVGTRRIVYAFNFSGPGITNGRSVSPIGINPAPGSGVPAIPPVSGTTDPGPQF